MNPVRNDESRLAYGIGGMYDMSNNSLEFNSLSGSFTSDF